ncbi:glycosyltransferase family 2 protein [Chiayiivirga flava]|uniref:Glycosyltransferase involved in cell wall biosynthesis n=1 Tax=Chiayiivirga flava TaxID=659595 RepID=A0A7W8D5T1_9GAMM|nr:glycosyltransferase involved in cell wall biosynthesis [Chiayiivirga flava]
MSAAFSPVVVIPVFDHEHAVGAMVRGVRAHGVPCLLVDDGSGPACAAVLDGLARGDAQVTLLRLRPNAGKGAAVMAGLREAGRRGHSHAVQIDADGQHATDDIPAFLARAAQHPDAVICGCPVYDASVPKARLVGRYATHIWVWINTLSFAIRDSMCGFRVYPLGPTLRLIDEEYIGRRMDFDSEILVRLAWRGIAVVNLPTPVTYPSDGVSHFDVLRDNVRITAMHTRLFFGMLRRLPTLLRRRFA